MVIEESIPFLRCQLCHQTLNLFQPFVPRTSSRFSGMQSRFNRPLYALCRKCNLPSFMPGRNCCKWLMTLVVVGISQLKLELQRKGVVDSWRHDRMLCGVSTCSPIENHSLKSGIKCCRLICCKIVPELTSAWRNVQGTIPQWEASLSSFCLIIVY